MKTRFYIVILVTFLVNICQGQTITVENFKKVSNTLLKKALHLSNVETDKNNAIIDFKTGQQGFVFKNANGEEIPVEENEGILTLKVPDKTRFIIINHPDIGDYTWRVPIKALKKKNRYHADLVAQNLTKEFKNPNQWLTFRIGPANSILTVDSTIYLIRDGHIELYLPVGTHKFTVESPYFESKRDSVLLTDENKAEITVMLEPISLLEEKLKKENHEPYTIIFNNGSDLDKKPSKSNLKNDSIQSVRVENMSEIYAEIHLITEDSLSQIKINRELVGLGEWKGQLSEGYYVITTEKNGVESVAQLLEITDNQPKELHLAVPMSSKGMINVRSNQAGAQVFLDNKLVGKTPCIIKDFKINENLTLLIKKDGYKDKEVVVRPKGNDIIEVDVKLTKSKKR